MIYGVDLLSKSKSNTSPALNKIDTEKSLFIEALNMMRDNEKMINDYLVSSKCKVAVSESKDITLLNEFSIKKLGTSIIDFFIDTIKALFTAFKNAFIKITRSNTVTDKYIDKLKTITSPFELTFDRYIYTYLDDNIPDLSLNIEFQNIYDEFQGKLQKLSNSRNNDERRAKLQSIEADINGTDLTPYYDNLRARILGNKYKYISERDYSNELFNVFRDGGNYTSNRVTPDELSTIIDRYKRNAGIVANVRMDQDRIIKDANTIKKELSNITLEKLDKDYASGLYDTNLEAIFQRIMSSKLGQIEKILEIYTMAFSAKLDALKDAYNQDRSVLAEAIQFYNTSLL